MPFSLDVQNFRCLHHVSWAPRGVCALVGANGSGKTTLLSTLRFLRDFHERGISTAAELQGGWPWLRRIEALPEEPLSLRLTADDVAWEVQPTVGAGGLVTPVGERVVRTGQTEIEQRTGVQGLLFRSISYPSSDRGALATLVEAFPEQPARYSSLLQVLGSYRLYEDPQLSTLRRTGSFITGDAHLHPTGGNAFSVLRSWVAGDRANAERAAFVKNALREAFPGLFEDFDFQEAGQIVTLRFYSKGASAPIPAYFAPEGLLRGLLHLAAVASAPEHGVVAIDEFENGLHPYAIRELLAAIRDRAARLDLTVLLATHSPFVLNEFNANPSQVYVIEASPAPQPVALDKLEDPKWLAHFALGDLYGDQKFGAQEQRPA